MSNRFLIFLSSLQFKARSTGTEWRSPCEPFFGTQVGTRISCFPTENTQTLAPPLHQLHWSTHFPLCKHRVWHQIFPPLKIITFPRLWACSFICRKWASMHFLLPRRSSSIFPGSTRLSPSPPSRLSHSDPLSPSSAWTALCWHHCHITRCAYTCLFSKLWADPAPLCL